MAIPLGVEPRLSGPRPDVQTVIRRDHINYTTGPSILLYYRLYTKKINSGRGTSLVLIKFVTFQQELQQPELQRQLQLQQLRQQQ